MLSYQNVEKSTIFLIEDDKNIRESLQCLFQSVRLNVETYSDAVTFLNSYDPTRYGCILIDVRLPGMSGLQLQEHLVRINNRIPVIIITGYGDVNLAVRAMKLGAKDVILKPFNSDVLLEQVQLIISQNKDQNRCQQFSKLVNSLTGREKEIMDLVVSGKSNKEIAAVLGITISTVEQHRFHFMQKLKVESLAELVKVHTLTMYNA